MIIKKTNETILRTVAITSAKTFAVVLCFLGFLGVLFAFGMRSDAVVNFNEILTGGFVSFLLFSVPLGYWFYWLYEREQQKVITEKYKELRGIGGWLVVFIIASIIQLSTWGNIAMESESGFIIGVATILFLLYLLMLGMLLTKSKRITLVVGLIFVVYFFLMALFGGGKEVFQSIVWLLIWPLYFVKSKRVRQTFVN